MRKAIACGAHANTASGLTASHARLTSKLGGVSTRSLQAVVSRHVLVTIVGTITIAIAHKLPINAATRRFALEHLRRTRVIARGAHARGGLVFAAAAIAIPVAEPRVRYAPVVGATELADRARHTITKEFVLVAHVATVVVTVAQPTSHDAHIRIGTLDVKAGGVVALASRTAHFVGAIAVLTLDEAVAATRHRQTFEVATLETVARRVHAVMLVTVVAALVETVASLRLRYAATVAAAKLRWQACVVRAKRVRLVAVVRAVALTVAHQTFAICFIFLEI